jgi:hypothetical protein
MKKIDLIIIILLCVSSFISIVIAGLIKLEHGSKSYENYLFFIGIVLSIITILYLFIKSRKQKLR